MVNSSKIITGHNKGFAMIDVQKYNPQWKNRFQSLSSQFVPHIEELVDDVLHLGDTSVCGLSAQPVIDINIVVKDFSNADRLAEKLLLVGYKKIEADDTADAITFKHTKSVPHSLQIIKNSSLKLKREKLLKKHLEENPTAFAELEALNKKYLQGKIHRAKYLEAKRKLVDIYVQHEGMSADELSQIA